MGLITRELLQQGLLDYFTLMVIFDADKQGPNGSEERGIASIEPKDITAVFSQEEYMQLYHAKAGVLASMLQSPRRELRELAYAYDQMHWKVRLEYARLEESTQ